MGTSIAPLVTSVIQLERLHIAKYNDKPRFIITNSTTAAQLVKEAQSVGCFKEEGNKNVVKIEDLVLVVDPRDNTQYVKLEVA